MCVGAPAGAFSEPKIATPQIFYISKIENVCGRSRRGFFRAQNSDVCGRSRRAFFRA